MVVGEGADDGRATGSDDETDGRCETNQRRRKRPDKQPRWRCQTGRAVKVRSARERERKKESAREPTTEIRAARGICRGASLRGRESEGTAKGDGDGKKAAKLGNRNQARREDASIQCRPAGSGERKHRGRACVDEVHACRRSGARVPLRGCASPPWRVWLKCVSRCGVRACDPRLGGRSPIQSDPANCSDSQFRLQRLPDSVGFAFLLAASLPPACLAGFVAAAHRCFRPKKLSSAPP